MNAWIVRAWTETSSSCQISAESRSAFQIVYLHGSTCSVVGLRYKATMHTHVLCVFNCELCEGGRVNQKALGLKFKFLSSRSLTNLVKVFEHSHLPRARIERCLINMMGDVLGCIEEEFWCLRLVLISSKSRSASASYVLWHQAKLFSIIRVVIQFIRIWNRYSRFG